MMRKSTTDDVLGSVEIASPCPANWASMPGDERVRFCGMCKKHVYNLSEMKRSDAEKLIQKTEGRICVRLFRRKDGTVLTNDCPVGLRAIQRTGRLILGGLAAAFAGIISYLGFPHPDPDVTMGKLAPPRSSHLMGELNYSIENRSEHLMGSPAVTNKKNFPPAESCSD